MKSYPSILKNLLDTWYQGKYRKKDRSPFTKFELMDIAKKFKAVGADVKIVNPNVASYDSYIQDDAGFSGHIQAAKPNWLVAEVILSHLQKQDLPVQP